MESNIAGILVTIIVYLGGMIAIGAVFSKKNKDVNFRFRKNAWNLQKKH